MSAGTASGRRWSLTGWTLWVFLRASLRLGSTSQHALSHEQPVPQVRICRRRLYLGKYEVTQDQWQAVMGNNPSEFSGCGRCPVEIVTWNDAQEFIARLNARPGAGKYRLPTEAEWEYAARAGTDTDTYAGDITNPIGNDPVLNAIAWYRKNSGGRTQPVGQKETQRVWPLRHAGERVGVGGGLGRRLSGRGGDRPYRSFFGFGLGDSRWLLDLHRQASPVGGSQRGPAG